VGGAGQPVEYGGGGALEYMDVGTTRAEAVDAIFGVEVYVRSVLGRSTLSRFIKESIPLKTQREPMSSLSEGQEGG